MTPGAHAAAVRAAAAKHGLGTLADGDALLLDLGSGATAAPLEVPGRESYRWRVVLPSADREPWRLARRLSAAWNCTVVLTERVVVVVLPRHRLAALLQRLHEIRSPRRRRSSGPGDAPSVETLERLRREHAEAVARWRQR